MANNMHYSSRAYSRQSSSQRPLLIRGTFREKDTEEKYFHARVHSRSGQTRLSLPVYEPLLFFLLEFVGRFQTFAVHVRSPDRNDGETEIFARSRPKGNLPFVARSISRRASLRPAS